MWKQTETERNVKRDWERNERTQGRRWKIWIKRINKTGDSGITAFATPKTMYFDFGLSLFLFGSHHSVIVSSALRALASHRHSHSSYRYREKGTVHDEILISSQHQQILFSCIMASVCVRLALFELILWFLIHTTTFRTVQGGEPSQEISIKLILHACARICAPISDETCEYEWAEDIN